MTKHLFCLFIHVVLSLILSLTDFLPGWIGVGIVPFLDCTVASQDVKQFGAPSGLPGEHRYKVPE